MYVCACDREQMNRVQLEFCQILKKQKNEQDVFNVVNNQVESPQIVETLKIICQ